MLIVFNQCSMSK